MVTEFKPLDPVIRKALSRISTATQITALLKRGLRNVRMRGTALNAKKQPHNEVVALSLGQERLENWIMKQWSRVPHC